MNNQTNGVIAWIALIIAIIALILGWAAFARTTLIEEGVRKEVSEKGLEIQSEFDKIKASLNVFKPTTGTPTTTTATTTN